MTSTPTSGKAAEDTREVLREASFERDSLIKYHWIGLIPVCVFIVTIPFVIIAAIVYAVFLDRIIASWSATLTTRSLIVRKGVFNKVERTIPLEKITDLSASQGPIMRYCGLKRLGVETAGQSTGAQGGSLVSLIGIRDTDDFRAAVLAQRDRATGASTDAKTPAATIAHSPSTPGASTDTIEEIASTLKRIEATLERLADRGTSN